VADDGRHAVDILLERLAAHLLLVADDEALAEGRHFRGCLAALRALSAAPATAAQLAGGDQAASQRIELLPREGRRHLEPQRVQPRPRPGVAPRRARAARVR